MKKIQILAFSLFFAFIGTNIHAQNTFFGTYAGNGAVGSNNTSLGYYAGDVVTGNNNSVLGANSGRYLSSGYENNIVGSSAGKNISSGHYNSFIGFCAGYYTSTGNYNIFLGQKTGMYNTTGNGNVALGSYTGHLNSTGSYNVYLGYFAGYYNAGSSNVFLGNRAGFYESGSNILYIENSNSSDPLIYGEFDDDLLSIGGRLGIGTRNVPDSIRLAVDGTIIAKEVIITIDNFPDYVFEKNYRLRSLSELESFISLNGHLPEVPSAEQVEKEGVKMGEMDAILLKKIEELTLYVIEMGKDNEKLQEANRELTERLQGIENMNGNVNK